MLARLTSTEVLGACPAAEKEQLSKNTPVFAMAPCNAILGAFHFANPGKMMPVRDGGLFVLVPRYSLPSAFHTDILRTRRDAALSGHTYKWEAGYARIFV